MRNFIDIVDVQEQSQLTLQLDDKITENEKEFNRRVIETALEFIDRNQELKYDRLAKRLDIYYPGITKYELYEYSSEILDKVIRNYEKDTE